MSNENNPTGQSEELEAIIPALEQEIIRQNLPIQLYSHIQPYIKYVRSVHIPAYVFGGDDAVEKAGILQQLEDSWNMRQPYPRLLLSLIPAFQPAPTQN